MSVGTHHLMLVVTELPSQCVLHKCIAAYDDAPLQTSHFNAFHYLSHPVKVNGENPSRLLRAVDG